MRKYILTAVLAVTALAASMAQQRMVRVIDGKNVDTVEVWKIDKVYFIPEVTAKAAAMDEPVDLGLSVRWAKTNLSATQGDKLIQLVGWGDTTMTNESKKLQYFPVENPTGNISNSQYDIARYKLGSEWRMPTIDELQELKDNCNWEWISRNDSTGYLLTSKVEGYTSNQLFLPVTGYREGKDIYSDGKVWLWSGTLGSTADNAKAVVLADGSELAAQEKPRYMGLAIRPVAGPLLVPVTISSTVTSSVAQTTAKVVATLKGDLKDELDQPLAQLVGVAYGTSTDALTHSDTNDDSHQVTTTLAETVTFDFSNLAMNTKYYAKVYVKTVDGDYVDGEAVSFTTLAKYPVPEYVDLGLPSGVRWAKWNIGSTSELDIPKTAYFGWGDPTGEEHRDNASYYAAYYAGGGYQFKKDISGTEYDIATVQWGDKWRIPTPDDFNEISELSGYTSWEYGNYSDSEGNGYPAWKVTSVKYPDRYIYFPAAGLYTTKGAAKQVKDYAYYWTSTDCGYGSANYAELIRSSTILPAEYGTQMPIRPVYGKPGESGGGESGGGESGGGESGGGESGGGESGGGESGGGESGGGDTPTPETAEVGTAVDLGLPSGTKWADRNIGAVSVTDYGDYITWGDSIERSPYSIANYIYTNANGVNGYTYLGTSENTSQTYSIGGTKYDAAHVRWKGTWRMPSRAQFNELIDNCTWTWTSQNGVWGYVVSRNNKSIFLPAAGYMSDQSLNSVSTNGYFWTDELENSLSQKFNINVRTFSIRENSKKISYDPRYKGLTIRPVQP